MNAEGSKGLRGTALVFGIAVVAILLIFFLPDRNTESRMHASGSTYGRILVDSPEVYTRERMVNDRFRQEAWLVKRLNELEETSIQGIIEEQKTSSRSLGMSATQNSQTDSADSEKVTDEESSKAAADDAEQSEATTTQTGQPQVTPIEAFREHQSFREEVRNAIIENQLDDRHDLGGNTLYRLKFDATIIPGNDTSVWAQINVRFKKTPHEQEEKQLRELYKRWMNDLREQVRERYIEELKKVTGDSESFLEKVQKAKEDKEAIYRAAWEDIGFRIGDSVGELTVGDLRDDEEFGPFEKMACRNLLFLREGQENRAETPLTVQEYSVDRYHCLWQALPALEICEPGTCIEKFALLPVLAGEETAGREVLAKVLYAFGTSLGDKSDLKRRFAEDKRNFLKNLRAQSEKYPGDSAEGPVEKVAAGDPSDDQWFVTFRPNQDASSILVEEYRAESFAVPVKLAEIEREEAIGYLAESLAESVWLIPVNLGDSERERAVDYRADKVQLVPVELSDSERDTFRYYNYGEMSDTEILDTWSYTMGCDDMVQVYVAGREYKTCDASIQAFANDEDVPTSIEPEYDGRPIFVIRKKLSDEEILNEWNSYIGCDDLVQVEVGGREFMACRSTIQDLANDKDAPKKIDAEIDLADSGQPFFVKTLSDEQILESWSYWLDCDSPVQVLVADRRFKVCDPSLHELARHREAPLEIDGKIQSGYDGSPPTLVARVGFQLFREKLRKSDEKQFLFSYAVTPRESSQQLASSSRLAVAEQVRADASTGLGGAGLDIGAGRSTLFSEYARIMERRPIVVGIASHGSSDTQRSAEFGWLIGPKLVVGSNGRTTYRHLPSQNSLAAIVSAPSWWESAYIEVETSWVDDEGKLDKNVTPIKFEYPIALPGDREEITSALLRGGKRPKPIVESVEPTRLKINEEAKILVMGQNLWRSTVVTIGAQRSKRIFVMPNMKGIIAEFDAIQEHATRPVKDSKTQVRVWTSEGVAPWSPGITITSEQPPGSGNPAASQ